MSPHYVFRCLNCGVPMPLHAGRIELPFQDLNPRPTHFPPVVVLCRNCNHVGMYTTNPNAPNHDRVAPQVVVCPEQDSYYDGLLGCGQVSCKSLVPFFGQWNDSISYAERNANLEIMIWGDIRCSEGHPIKNPATLEGGPYSPR